MKLKVRSNRDFHNAGDIAIIATPEQDGRVRVTPMQARRLIKHFCGVIGCLCAPFKHLEAYDKAGNKYQLIAWYE